MRTSIISRTSLNFGQIGPPTTELNPPERLKNTPIDLQWERWCLHFFLAVYGPILFILAGNEDMHKSLDEFEFWPDLRTDYGVTVQAAKCYDQSRLITWNFESHVTFLRGFGVDITRKYREFCVERRDRT